MKPKILKTLSASLVPWMFFSFPKQEAENYMFSRLWPDKITQADFTEAALGSTETTETNLGTLTIPSAGVSRIVGVYGILEEITTTAEQGVGYFRLSFKTVAGSFKFPCATFQAPAGTLASPGFSYEPKIIPVNIPVPANETITAYMATFVAATGACRGMVGIIME